MVYGLWYGWDGGAWANTDRVLCTIGNLCRIAVLVRSAGEGGEEHNNPCFGANNSRWEGKSYPWEEEEERRLLHEASSIAYPATCTGWAFDWRRQLSKYAPKFILLTVAFRGFHVG